MGWMKFPPNQFGGNFSPFSIQSRDKDSDNIKMDKNFLQTGLDEITSNPHKIVPSI
jgi:hypothetical protein